MNTKQTVRHNLHVKKGDIVMIISGNDKGEKGKILSVDRKKQRVVVEGWNMRTVHTKPNAANPEGGIIKKEGSIHVSNVMVVDKSGVPTRTGKAFDKNGKKYRYSKKSQDKKEEV